MVCVVNLWGGATRFYIRASPVHYLGKNMFDAYIHFIPMTKSFSALPTPRLTLLNAAVVQHTLLPLKLALNADQTKLRWFSNSRNSPELLPQCPILSGSFVHISWYLAHDFWTSKKKKRNSNWNLYFLFPK